MTQKNLAFSLIEMIVGLVILLIISVVSYPVLNKYLVQSKVSDAIQAATTIQTMVTNQIASLGSATDSGVGLNVPTTISRYVSSATVSDDGVISITTTSNAGSISFTLSPVYDATSEQISWACAVTDSDMNDFVPSKCRI